MATLTKGELLEIAYAATEPAVSIFMPTHHAGAAEIRQDPIRLNNLLNEAETRLTGRGLRRPDAEALLEPAAELIDSPDFWQHRSEGLALYLARGFMRFIDLPYQPEERLSIGPNFRLRPLLGLFERSERYTVVSVSFAGARVFTADRERLAERTDLSLPQGIREIMAETDYQRMTNAAPTLRLRSASPGSVSGKHGFGEAPEELRKAELIEYLHRLDAALLPVLSNRHEPVIIVGDPQVSGHFHSLSKLPNLHSEALEVNAEALPLAELHRRTMLLAEPTFGRAKQSALEHLRTSMPFPLRGFDTDNGGEFMNETVAAYCRLHEIPCTWSRPYHKNDQAWVEQKNGSVVRRLVGYRRLEGLAAAEALSRLYAASRLFVNFFQPSFKLASKIRTGAKVRKTYHAPETPYTKLLASVAISTEMKERLRAVAEQLDPLRLLEEFDRCKTTWRRCPLGRRPTSPFATRDTSRASSRVWPPRGNTARSAPPIGASRGPRVIGGPG